MVARARAEEEKWMHMYMVACLCLKYAPFAFVHIFMHMHASLHLFLCIYRKTHTRRENDLVYTILTSYSCNIVFPNCPISKVCVYLCVRVHAYMSVHVCIHL